jgi:diguanylate cyclase (GGDEF)-like protein
MRKTLLLLLMLMIGANAHAAETRRVLVLHSYYQGWEWTDHITEGIQSVFNPFRKNIALYMEYLDANRHGGADYFQKLASFYQLKYKSIRFDVVIVSDDPAVHFKRMYGDRLAPGASVLFCGRNAVPSAKPPLEAQPAGGLWERLDHGATLRLMLHLHPHCRRILFLIDSKAVDWAAIPGIEAMVAAIEPGVTTEVWQDTAIADLPAKLVALNHGDLIYLFDFHHDLAAQDTAAAERIRTIARWSPVPAYSSLDFYMGKGIVGGMITSGFRQGQLVAQMALRLLSGERVASIPSLADSANQYMFDQQALQKFGIDSSRLPAGSIIINPPAAFWMRHGAWLSSIIGGLVLLSVFLSAALLGQRRHRRTLAQTNVALNGRLREKTSLLQLADQKLRHQSLIDGTTGIANRRHVVQRLTEEAIRVQRYGQPLSAVVFYIADFKRMTDQYGFVVCNRILRDVGHAIRRIAREIDTVGRFGGESFLLVLPNTDLEQGHRAADRVAQAIRSLQWEQGRIRISVGTGIVQCDAHPPEELIKLVEKLINTAKDEVSKESPPEESTSSA